MNEENINTETSPMSLRQIIRYLKGVLSDKEQNKVEKGLLEDPFEGEAMEGFALLDEESVSDDLRYLRQSVQKRTTGSGNKKFAAWQMAAAFLLLAVFSFGVWTIIRSDRALQIAYEQNIKLEEEKVQLEKQIQAQREQVTKTREEPGQEPSPESRAGDEPETLNKSQQSTESTAGEPKIASPTSELAAIEPPDEEPKKTGPDETLPSIIEDVEEENAMTEYLVEDEDLVSEDLALAAPQKKAAARSMAREAAVMAANVAGNEKLSELEYRTITGRVISAEDGGPVAQALLSLQGSQTEVYSSIDGYFELLLPVGEDIVLRVRRAGYLPNEVRFETSELIEIFLEPDTSLSTDKIILGYDMPSDPYYSPPRPLGGNTALKDFIDANLNLPDSAISGIVHIQFTVSTKGTLEKIHVVSSPDSALDEEVIRILQQGPPWYPAEQNGQTISSEVDLRIRL